MKIEGVKKIHLIASSLLYLIMIIVLSLPENLQSGTYLRGLSIALFFVAFVVLFFTGLWFLIYYLVRKEKLMAKVLSLLNVSFVIAIYLLGNPFDYFSNVGVITTFLLLLLLLFNLYLYWSREK